MRAAFARFLLPLLVVVSVSVECQENVGGFATPLSILMSTRNSMVRKMTSIASNVDDVKVLRNYVQALKDLKKQAREFIDSSLTSPESKNTITMLKGVISQDRLFSDEEALYNSYSLKKDKKDRLGTLWERMTQNMEQFLASGDQTHAVPLSTVCQALPLSALYSMTKNYTKETTMQDVCTGLSSCARRPKPYHYKQFVSVTGNRRSDFWWLRGGGGSSSSSTAGLRLPWFPTDPPKPKPTPDPYFEQDLLQACTADSQCNVQKALPMMTGIFWYKIGELIVQRLCSQKCAGESYNYSDLYQSVIQEADLLISYATTLPSYWKSTWDPFFKDAVARQAFVKLDVALTMVEEKMEDFEAVGKLCYFFKFTKACPISDLYKQYNMIKKIQLKRSQVSSVKDLRLYAQMDHSQMINLQSQDLRQLELLGSIKKLDDNLQASVAGISKYFEGLAKFDEGIALADVAFIQGELNKYETSLKKIETKIKDDIKEAMNLMKTILTANLVEQIALLGILIATNSNPLKIIFTGPDIKDILEQTGKVAEESSQLVKGSALLVALDDLSQDSLELGAAFIGNKNQISSLHKVVVKIRTGQANNIGEDADLFIKEYGAYTPQTDRSRLAKNDALWAAYKEATCDLLNGEVGIAGAVPKSIAGGKLLCERLDGTLAQFITLREDIFDFQFQLVDAIASVVRGNIAQRLARGIKGKHEVLHASQFMTGFFMMQNKIQTVSSVYCDKLEYQQLGKSVSACATADGLFRKENIDALIAFRDNSPYDKVERDVYIPTRGSFEGDTSFIDLLALARGETVIFKIPAHKKWLREHRWNVPGEDIIPFVESFKLFLPQREYKTGSSQEQTTTKVTIASVAGSSVSINTGVVYILPRGHSTYRTVYEEGYRSCSTEIDNPYSLCNNLPKMCDKTTRSAGTSLLPTIVSSWSLQHAVYQGSRQLTWDAPSPGTNLLLQAKVILRVPSMGRKRHNVSLLGLPRSDVVMSQNGCCEGNRYRSSMYNRKCAVCPAETTSSLGGLYCQIDE